MNTFGQRFRFTSFGESHGPAVGGVIDGCPAGLRIDIEAIRRQLARRASGGSERAAAEPDEVVWLGGIAYSSKEKSNTVPVGETCCHTPSPVGNSPYFRGRVNDDALEGELKGEPKEELITNGAPIAFYIANKAQRPEDYDNLRNVFRPGHADYTYYIKYGLKPQPGGGRASARETAARVVAGCIAAQLLAEKGVKIEGEADSPSDGSDRTEGTHAPTKDTLLRPTATCLGNSTRATGSQSQSQFDPQAAGDCFTPNLGEEFSGDSIGGIVRCKISGLPAGIGEPIFDKLQARLAYAMLSINACKGFEYGAGFAAANMRGSEYNRRQDGIAGGISDGHDIEFRVVFKPASSIALPQQAQTIDGKTVEITIQGRHDRCIAVRAVPVVEAMAALVLADYML